MALAMGAWRRFALLPAGKRLALDPLSVRMAWTVYPNPNAPIRKLGRIRALYRAEDRRIAVCGQPVKEWHARDSAVCPGAQDQC
jgi:hypothetical protein